MQKTQRTNEPGPCSDTVIFLRIGFFLMLFLVCNYSLTHAQQTAPDTIRKVKQDTLPRPVTPPTATPVKPVTDTLPKPKNTTDTASKPANSGILAKPSQTFDPLVKPTQQPDTLKTKAATDSSITPVSKPDSANSPKTQPGNPPAQASQPAAQPADSSALKQNAAGITDPGPDAKTITGKVVDEKGVGLPGVSVLVKDTQIQAITETDGSFTMKVPAQAATLVYSFIGFTSQEIAIGNKTQFSVQLKTRGQSIERSSSCRLWRAEQA
jgi:hypothetical protein